MHKTAHIVLVDRCALFTELKHRCLEIPLKLALVKLHRNVNAHGLRLIMQSWPSKKKKKVKQMKMKLPEARESKMQFFKTPYHGPRMEFCHNQTDFSQTNKKAADGPFQKHLWTDIPPSALNYSTVSMSANNLDVSSWDRDDQGCTHCFLFIPESIGHCLLSTVLLNWFLTGN